MYEFLERLIKTALPRIRDFRGVSTRAFDGRGNYTLGVTDQTIFPEIELDKIQRNIGLDVTIVTIGQHQRRGQVAPDRARHAVRRQEEGCLNHCRRQNAEFNSSELPDDAYPEILTSAFCILTSAFSHERPVRSNRRFPHPPAQRQPALQKVEVNLPCSRIKGDVARVLKQEGYIADYAVSTAKARTRRSR